MLLYFIYHVNCFISLGTIGGIENKKIILDSIALGDCDILNCYSGNEGKGLWVSCSSIQGNNISIIDLTNSWYFIAHTLEIQLEACFALIVCGAGFIKLLLVNMSALPTSSQIVTSGILVFVGGMIVSIDFVWEQIFLEYMYCKWN